MNGVAVPQETEKYWFNLTTGEVEFGMQSPSVERAGPFDTAEEAAQAPEIIRQRARAWAEEEAADDSWGSAAGADDDGE